MDEDGGGGGFDEEASGSEREDDPLDEADRSARTRKAAATASAKAKAPVKAEAGGEDGPAVSTAAKADSDMLALFRMDQCMHAAWMHAELQGIL